MHFKAEFCRKGGAKKLGQFFNEYKAITNGSCQKDFWSDNIPQLGA